MDNFNLLFIVFFPPIMDMTFSKIIGSKDWNYHLPNNPKLQSATVTSKNGF